MIGTPLTGTLFGTDVINDPGVIRVVDLTSGVATVETTIMDGGNPVAVGAIGFAGDGTLYAAEGNNVINGLTIGTVDVAGGTYTPHLDVPANTSVAGLDVAPNGVLFAVYATFSPFEQTLVRINPLTWTVIDERPIGGANVSDLDYAGNGKLYHTNASSTLFEIDPVTGMQTNLGFGTAGQLGGLASETVPDVIFANGMEP